MSDVKGAPGGRPPGAPRYFASSGHVRSGIGRRGPLAGRRPPPPPSSWGIDHGTWSVLLHAFPDASVPVVQLSLNAFKDFDHHLELGRKLGALRDHGVLVIGSGNVVHNLRAVYHRRPDSGYDWATRFDQRARETLETAPTEVASLDGHPDFERAVPTPDHYLPLLYIAGLAGEEPLDLLVDGHAAGSISMAAYTLGMACDTTATADAGPAARLPDGFPALDSNV